jgi:hypothetical protein
VRAKKPTHLNDAAPAGVIMNQDAPAVWFGCKDAVAPTMASIACKGDQAVGLDDAMFGGLSHDNPLQGISAIFADFSNAL